MKAKNYKQGTLFRIPLDDEREAIGLIVIRSEKGGIMYGYFFENKEELYEGDFNRIIKNERCLLKARFGDLHLRDGTWPIIDGITYAIPNEWAEDHFTRKLHDYEKRQFGPEYNYWMIKYSHHNLAHETARAPSVIQDRTMPRDGLLGAGAVEAALKALLSGRTPAILL